MTQKMNQSIQSNFRFSGFVTTLLISFVALVASQTGCDRTYVADNPKSDSNVPDVSDGVLDVSQTNSVSPDNSMVSVSPATKAKVATDSDPKEVCRKFMSLLQAEKRIEAENLLTRTALTVTTRAGLQLEPLGDDNPVFKINDVRYATTKKKLAQVECSIEETVDGKPYRVGIVWLVRKQAAGWRISGLMLETEPGKAKDLLSFENIQDVNRMKMLVSADVVEGNSRQAMANDAKLK